MRAIRRASSLVTLTAPLLLTFAVTTSAQDVTVERLNGEHRLSVDKVPVVTLDKAIKQHQLMPIPNSNIRVVMFEVEPSDSDSSPFCAGNALLDAGHGDPRHADRNFGDLLSVWDHLFGTQWRGYDEYPDSGIEDAGFPVERSVRGLAVVTDYLHQVAYPFRIRKLTFFGPPPHAHEASEVRCETRFVGFSNQRLTAVSSCQGKNNSPIPMR